MSHRNISAKENVPEWYMSHQVRSLFVVQVHNRILAVEGCASLPNRARRLPSRQSLLNSTCKSIWAYRQTYERNPISDWQVVWQRRCISYAVLGPEEWCDDNCSTISFCRCTIMSYTHGKHMSQGRIQRKAARLWRAGQKCWIVRVWYRHAFEWAVEMGLLPSHPK